MSLCIHQNIFSHCPECTAAQRERARITGLNTFNNFFHLWQSAKNGQRLGQLFCNMYLKDSETAIPGLFYETNLRKATEMIRQWLTDNQYFDQLPPVRNPTFQHVGDKTL